MYSCRNSWTLELPFVRAGHRGYELYAIPFPIAREGGDRGGAARRTRAQQAERDGRALHLCTPARAQLPRSWARRCTATTASRSPRAGGVCMYQPGGGGGVRGSSVRRAGALARDQLRTCNYSTCVHGSQLEHARPQQHVRVPHTSLPSAPTPSIARVRAQARAHARAARALPRGAARVLDYTPRPAPSPARARGRLGSRLTSSCRRRPRT